MLNVKLQEKFKYANLLGLIVIALFFVAGCGGRESGGISSSQIPNLAQVKNAPKISRITGSIIDENGLPITNATVKMLGMQSAGARIATDGITDTTTTTDTNGTFSFNLASTPTEDTRLILKITHPAYVDNNTVFRVQYGAVEDNQLFLPVKMIRIPESTVSSTKAEIVRSDGTTQVVEPQTVTDPTSGLTVTQTTVTIDENVQQVTFSVPSPKPVETNVDSVAFTIGGSASGGGRKAAPPSSRLA